MWRNKTHDLSNLQFYTENKNGERMLTVFCRNVKFVYKCPFRLCNPPLTFSELFAIITPYFDDYISKYRSYKLKLSPVTNYIYKIIMFYALDFKPLDFSHGELLYEIEKDDKYETLYEYKNTKLLNNNPHKVKSFFVNIEIELYNKEKFFNYEGLKDPRIENDCIICYRNKPNVLITKCFHLVCCHDCVRFNKLKACPFCFKPFSEIHKIIFAVSWV